MLGNLKFHTSTRMYRVRCAADVDCAGVGLVKMVVAGRANVRKDCTQSEGSPRSRKSFSTNQFEKSNWFETSLKPV